MTQAIYVLISAKSGKERELLKELMKQEEVKEGNILYGQYDVMIRIEAENIKQIDDFIWKHIRNHPDIQQTQSLVVVTQ